MYRWLNQKSKTRMVGPAWEPGTWVLHGVVETGEVILNTVLVPDEVVLTPAVLTPDVLTPFSIHIRRLLSHPL